MVVSVGKKAFRVSSAKMSKAARTCLATMLSLSVALQPALVSAQIIADPDAGAGYRPDIGAAPNGVPLVDITTPNGRGLSHNKYFDFNVGRPGAILNNHDREAGTSQLGGVTPGNPHLRYSGSASVILNEVTSSSRSALQGPVEVFGRRADVVIANPNGITCNGCGFINTPRATLATGIPEIGIDGMLRGFHVSGGDVTFGPDGANLLSGKGAVDIFDIVSRTIKIDGPVAGHDIGVTAGTGRFDYASREMKELATIAGTPEYAIDGSALGALQAGRIKIVVTEKGAGVRMRSDMAANAGQLTLSADGRISLNNVSGRDGVSVTSGSHAVTARKITSKKTVALKAANGIHLQAVAADENIMADAGRGLLSVAGDMQARGHISLGTSGRITGDQFVSGGNLEVHAGNGIEVLAAVADRQAVLKTARGDIIAKNGIKAGGGDLVVTAEAGDITAATLISYHDAVIHAGRDLHIAGNILAAGNIMAVAGAIKAAGTVSGLDFAVSSASADGNPVLKKSGETQLIARSGAVMAGQVISGGNTKITAHNDISYNSVNSFGSLDLVSDYGSISFHHSTSAAGDINLKAQVLDLSNNRAKISTARTLCLYGQTVDLSNSQLVFGGLVIDGGKTVEAHNSSLSAITKNGGSGNISITAPAFTSNQSTDVIAENDLNIRADSIANSGQMAAGNDLWLVSEGDLHNNKTGLIFAGNDARLFAGGHIINDQGAVIAEYDLIIAGLNEQSRNQSVTNVSGLIKAGNNATILTNSLVNKRLAAPVWGNHSVSSGKVADFELNREMRDKKYIYMHTRQHDAPRLFPGPLEIWSDYEPHMWSEAVLADGTSYRAWTWKATRGPDYEDRIYRWAAARVLRDADGNPIIDPENYSREFIVNLQNSGVDRSLVFHWDWDSGISQTVYEDYLTVPLEAEAIIQAGNNLRIEADTITNSYSSIEAGGDADITSKTLTNEGLTLNRTYLTTCSAQGVCSAYDAKGERDPNKDIASGTSIITRTEVIGTVSGNIKAGGVLRIKTGSLNNTAASGSIAGGAQYTPESTAGNPLDALDGLTAGGALFRPNMDAGFDRKAPEFDSGGFGGTLPGQYFIYETRPGFIDTGNFYGSSYYLNRIGYKPDRQILFLGDAYFENQLIEKQIRDLVGSGLGKGSFIPGNNSIEQIKNLLDRGAEYSKKHGLAFGVPLTSEQQAALKETIVVYVKQIVNGRDVYAPVVYIAQKDRENAAAGGANMSGGTVHINADDLSNSGYINSAKDLHVSGITIKSNGGTFAGRGDIVLAATGDMTLSAQALNIGAVNVVNPNRIVDAGGNASLSATNDLTLQGASVHAAGDMALSGSNVALDARKADNNGSQNATGSSLVSGGSLTVQAEQNVNVLGSSANAGGDLQVEARKGSVSIITTDVTRNVNDGFMQTTEHSQQRSQLSSGNNTTITAGDDILVLGSKIKAGHDVTVEASDDVSISTAREQKNRTWGENNYWNSTTHKGSEVEAEGNVSIKAGSGQGEHDLNIIGSSVKAAGIVALEAANNVIIAQATDNSQLHYEGKSSKESVVSDRETNTVVGSSVQGGAGVNIRSGDGTVISASDIEAGSGDNQADLNISTGGNLVVSSANNSEEQNDRTTEKGFLKKSKGKYHDYDENTAGSSLSASGSVKLNAGEHAVIAGSGVAAGEDINIAGKSVSVIGGQENHSRSSEKKKSGLGAGSGDDFYSVWGQTSKKQQGESIVNSGSSLLAGGDVNITARESDVNIIGSQVTAGYDITLDAARDVNITPGHESAAASETEKRSGFGFQLSHSNSSASIGLGYGSSKDKRSESHSINAKSGLVSGNDVNITAGRDASLQAADVDAGRDVNLNAARDVNLLAANDVSNYEEMHEKLFAGVKATVSENISGTIDNIKDTARRAGHVSDTVSAANAASSGLKSYDTVKNIANGGNLVGASITGGFEHEKSKSSSTIGTAVTTDINAGRSVTVDAGRDLTSKGAQISAGFDGAGYPVVSDDDKTGDITLKAGRDIVLESAQNTGKSSSSHRSARAGSGIQAGIGIMGPSVGPTADISAGGGKFRSNGTGQTNTHVTGTGDIVLESGRDTSLAGAVVRGDTVTVDVGRDLNIISVPDTGSSKDKSASAGISFGGGEGGTKPSGIHLGGGKGSGSTKWVDEQSGLVSDGRMDVTVGGNTHLGGGKIISDSGELTLDTGTITHEDLSGHRKYEGAHANIGIDLTGGAGVPGNPTGNNTIEGSTRDDDTEQQVRATVGPGEIIIRDGEKQASLESSGSTAPVEELNRDPDKAYEITKDRHTELDFYLSTQSVTDTVKGIGVAGKAVGEVLNEVGRRLSQKGEISPIELAKVNKIADAIDKGNLDFAALFNCSGRQGFNLFDLLVSTAHASTGCPVLDKNGKLVAELTPKEREDCIRYLVAILDEYGGYLTGGDNGDIRVPDFVKNAASWIRWAAGTDDETVIKLAQVPGAAIGLVREVAARKLLGEENYAEFERTIAPLVEAGELFGEALDRYLDEFKQKHNIPDQDAKDFALIVKAGSATVIAAIIGPKAVKNKGMGNVAGASNIKNSHFLRMQLSAEQAAGVKMPTQISGYTKHGLNQAISRDGIGVSPRAIKDAFDNPISVSGQSGGRFIFKGNDATIVVNKSGKIITTWSNNSQGHR